MCSGLYEFSLGSRVETPDWKSSNYQGFLMAFRDALESVGAQKIFGLCKYPGDDFEGRVETAIGRANVNLKLSEVSLTKIVCSPFCYGEL